MFGIFEDLTKAVVGVVKLPIDVAADVVTLGGALTDKDKPYTAAEIERIVRNLNNATKPNEH